MHNKIANDILDSFGEAERNSTQMRTGTISDDSPLAVKLGGSDTAYTDVIALDGAGALAVGDKVLCSMFGNALVILGRLTTTPGIESFQHNPNADLNPIGTGDANIGTNTYTTIRAGDWLFVASFDFVVDVAGAANMQGKLSVGGALQGDIARHSGLTVGFRMATQVWKVSGVAASTAIRLAANKDAAAGTMRCISANTSLIGWRRP